MPLNESIIPRRGSGLTQQQKRQQMASLYGLPITDLSDAELQSLRRIIAAQPPNERNDSDTSAFSQ